MLLWLSNLKNKVLLLLVMLTYFFTVSLGSRVIEIFSVAKKISKTVKLYCAIQRCLQLTEMWHPHLLTDLALAGNAASLPLHWLCTGQVYLPPTSIKLGIGQRCHIPGTIGFGSITLCLVLCHFSGLHFKFYTVIFTSCIFFLQK